MAGAVRIVVVVCVAGFALLLWGGYVRHWGWTGFGENDTLWDWLSLLLLPIVLAALPVLLTRRSVLDRRRWTLAGAIAAGFLALVLAGYLVPWIWTGFPGNELWDWLLLLVLPAVLGTAGLWADRRRHPRRRDVLVVAIALGVFAIVVVGGYAWGWTWTGFDGNTLWDWTELLLVPVLVPTVLVPAALAWLASRAAPENAGPAGTRLPQQRRGGPRATVLVALAAVLAAGGVAGTLLLADHPEEQAQAQAASRERDVCHPPGSRTVVADGGSAVYRLADALYACRRGGPRIRLGDRGAVSRVRVAGDTVAYARERCAAPRRCATAIRTLRLGRDATPRLRARFARTGGAAGLEIGDGALAVLLRGECRSGPECSPPSLYIVDAQGTRVVDAGTELDENSLAGTGATVYWRDSGHAEYAPLGG